MSGLATPKLRVGAGALAHFPAIDLRQHQIQHDQVRRVPGDPVERRLPVLGGDNGKLLLLQIHLHQIDDVLLVVDNQNKLLRQDVPPVRCRSGVRAVGVWRLRCRSGRRRLAGLDRLLHDGQDFLVVLDAQLGLP